MTFVCDISLTTVVVAMGVQMTDWMIETAVVFLAAGVSAFAFTCALFHLTGRRR